MRKFLHKVAHKLRWNKGRVVTCRKNGLIKVGFQCDVCGKTIVDKDDKYETLEIID